MHVHACQTGDMRTTVEIPDHQRAKLMEIAARRGLIGFSLIVQEAIEQYLEQTVSKNERVQAALSVLGTMDTAEADEIEESVRELRGRWR